MTVAPISVHPGRKLHRSRWVLVAILAFLLGGLAVALLYQSEVFGGSSNSTNEGSGVPATQSRDVAAFKSVELAGNNNLVIRVGEKQSVVVKAEKPPRQRYDRGAVGQARHRERSRQLHDEEPDERRDRGPTLDAVTLTGNGNLVVDGIEAESLKVTCQGMARSPGTGPRRGSMSRSAAREPRGSQSSSGTTYRRP